MKVDVLLGLQWGDEGKGKVVDVVTPKYDVIARFQGGPNAGHSLEFNHVKHVLHLIPSGIFHQDKINIIGNGVVIDPITFKEEIDELDKLGVDYKKSIRISKKAHLILPTHRLLDKASEQAKGKTKIGSTLKGIGPAYMDKTGRNGLRVGDILSPDFEQRYQALIDKHVKLVEQYQIDYDLEQFQIGWHEGIELIKQFQLIDSEYEIDQAIKDYKTVLAEGAQGTLLDIDFGSYPYVTSSNTITAGACTGLGVAPAKIGSVIGIFKAYCTRVGSGPFPTELHDNQGENLRDAGCEFGATTGRPRRCGWLDLVALKYSVMLNGVTELVMTKADVFKGLGKIKICTSYVINGQETDHFPFEVDGDIQPVYTEFDGWDDDLVDISDFHNLPDNLKNYIKFIEKETGVPIRIISVGPDRSQTIFNK